MESIIREYFSRFCNCSLIKTNSSNSDKTCQKLKESNYFVCYALILRMSDESVIVVDNSSSMCKAGFACDDELPLALCFLLSLGMFHCFHGVMIFMIFSFAAWCVGGHESERFLCWQ